MSESSDLILKYIPPTKSGLNARWVVVQDWVSPGGYKIPAGFITDGVSVPSFLRWFLLPTGKIFTAAIVHDYIIEVEGNWQKANEMLFNELEHCGISAAKRNLIRNSVDKYLKARRLFGVPDNKEWFDS